MQLTNHFPKSKNCKKEVALYKAIEIYGILNKEPIDRARPQEIKVLCCFIINGCNMKETAIKLKYAVNTIHQVVFDLRHKKYLKGSSQKRSREVELNSKLLEIKKSFDSSEFEVKNIKI